MSISQRILFGFGFATLLILALGIYALGEIGATRDIATAIVARDLVAYRQIGDVRDAQEELASNRLVLTGLYFRTHAGLQQSDPGAVERAVAAWQHNADVTASALVRARGTVADFLARSDVQSARRQVWQSVADTLQQADMQFGHLRHDAETLIRAMQAGDTPAVLAADTPLTNDRAEFVRLNSLAFDLVSRGAGAGQLRAQQVYDQSRMSIAFAVLVALAFAIAATLLLRRSIALPLEKFTQIMERAGEGDLSVRFPAGQHNELLRLGGSLNAMLDGLRAIAQRSREATENLNVSVAEIRASAQEQAASVEQQLAAVQETAATVDEITHSGAQIARRAQEVIESAQATALMSAGGLNAVQETGRAMAQIQSQGEAVAGNIVSLSEKTAAIGEIVSSVNDISERTHLLALNAAIEAASAGEHGRSFAVVASEMKSLADQAREATQQVRAILGDIQRGINVSVMLTEEAVKRGAAGAERTELAQATIEEMAAGIQEAVETFQQIVASTNQQQLGIEQVMTALRNIRQASQQTAAGTRQLDGAASSLGALSRELLSVAERFRI